MSVVDEEQKVTRLFDNIETVEDVAKSLDQEPREKLLLAVWQLVAEVGPIRPRIAAGLLGVSERTVRSWTTAGVLTPAEAPSRRLQLEPVRLHEVMHLVRDLRAAGHDRNLLDTLWYRLRDRALLEREDFAESLEQILRGEGEILSKPAPG
jgi:DNA-binding transcriptional MerR regulator